MIFHLKEGRTGSEFSDGLGVPHVPGSKFVYSTHASYMLSALVQKVTGKTLWAYLQEKLFTPLGITGEWWEESPQHISVGGWGLMLVTEDYAKIGQFLLQNGKWNGQQLLDAEWVRKAVSCQVSNRENPTPNPMGAPDFSVGLRVSDLAAFAKKMPIWQAVDLVST